MTGGRMMENFTLPGCGTVVMHEFGHTYLVYDLRAQKNVLPFLLISAHNQIQSNWVSRCNYYTTPPMLSKECGPVIILYWAVLCSKCARSLHIFSVRIKLAFLFISNFLQCGFLLHPWPILCTASPRTCTILLIFVDASLAMHQT